MSRRDGSELGLHSRRKASRRNFLLAAGKSLLALSLPLVFPQSWLAAASSKRSKLALADLPFASLDEIVEAIRAKDLSATAVTGFFLERIRLRDKAKGPRAFVVTNEKGAQADARSLDRRASGKLILRGVPIAVKDDLKADGLALSLGSKATGDWRPRGDSFAVSKLRAAGAIILGKTNLDEFTWGVKGGNSRFGQTLNPYDPTRTPGGSSAGSAAAVACGFCVAAIGSDASGSVRLPASACGVVAYKPTLGFLSRSGLTPFVPTMDTLGILARSAKDAARVASGIAGKDPDDPLTERAPAWTMPRFGSSGLKGVRIGHLVEYTNSADPAVKNMAEFAVQQLKKLGATIVEIKAYPPATIQQAVKLISGYEFRNCIVRALQLANPKATEKEFLIQMDRSVATLFQKAGEIPRVAYEKALRSTREDVIKHYKDSLELVDLILYPTMPVLPPPLRSFDEATDRGFEAIQDLYFSIRKCAEISGITGFPSVSIPAGLSGEGLPVGVELMGAPFGDAHLLEVAHAFEGARGAMPVPAMAGLKAKGS